MKKKFVNIEEAVQVLSQQGLEFAVVHNPEYVYPQLEIYPLAEKILTHANTLTAIVCDLDGTLATTEEISIYALEFTVRQISGKYTRESWKGFDPIIDYPNIIGNSTTKHIEYLISRYNNFINPDCLKKAWFCAAVWTMSTGHDKSRTDEVKFNLINLGCKNILHDQKLKELISGGIFDEDLILDYFLPKYGNDFNTKDFSGLVRAATDIFYYRYHEILGGIKSDKGEALSGEQLKDNPRYLIEMMPGVGIFLAFIKGWLADEIQNFIPLLNELMRNKNTQHNQPFDSESKKVDLTRLAKLFEKKPLSIAVVTSSIYYETDIVLTELFKEITIEIDSWPVPEGKKSFLKTRFSDYTKFFDAVVTADDSNEIRLKPHRDLFSIALHKIGVPKNKFDEVIGLEDSESGIISLRTAGIGRCIAVPFSKTGGQDFSLASHTLYGGLPELLLNYNMFLNI
jgi:FMN phosphatase YigB (HAD superfamily)